MKCLSSIDWLLSAAILAGIIFVGEVGYIAWEILTEGPFCTPWGGC